MGIKIKPQKLYKINHTSSQIDLHYKQVKLSQKYVIVNVYHPLKRPSLLLLTKLTSVSALTQLHYFGPHCHTIDT